MVFNLFCFFCYRVYIKYYTRGACPSPSCYFPVKRPLKFQKEIAESKILETRDLYVAKVPKRYIYTKKPSLL
jgi:hypothetical protein